MTISRPNVGRLRHVRTTRPPRRHGGGKTVSGAIVRSGARLSFLFLLFRPFIYRNYCTSYTSEFHPDFPHETSRLRARLIPLVRSFPPVLVLVPAPPSRTFTLALTGSPSPLSPRALVVTVPLAPHATAALGRAVVSFLAVWVWLPSLAYAYAYNWSPPRGV